VEIEGVAGVGMMNVVLPFMANEILEHRDGSDKVRQSRKLPGAPHFGTLTLSRGFNGALDLYQWWKAASEGDLGARRDVVVHLQNEAADQVVASWLIKGAWPVLYALSELDGLTCDVLTETLEVACESVEME
jgi:phage tail-like protein